MGTLKSEHIFLKWNNFENNLACGFIDLLHQEAMVDVTLAAEGKLIQAHKIVLSISSSYFRNIFQMNPCQHPIVILQDVGYEDLIDMLDFMYRGEASVKQQNLPSFLRLADTLKVKGLAGAFTEAPEKHLQELSIRKGFPVNYAKEATTTENNNGNTNVHMKKGFPVVEKRRKRSLSPVNVTDSKVNCHNYKSGFYDKNNKYSYMNDIQCLNVKEETLSNESFDSCGEEVCDNQMANFKVPGPPGTDESETVRRGEEMSESDLSESRLLPGPSRAEDLCETIPQETIISRRASKPLSLIWSFFNFDCHENKSECKLCGKVFKACPKTGTASVKYHLHFAHQILRNEGECKFIQ